MENGEERGRKRGQLIRAVLAALAVLLLALFVPPFISVSHYRGRITNLISRSLGRPVRLSNVEVRLLPWPGFVLYDLSVAEDPAYGAEPVLHANKVVASIRLFALLQGRVEIGTISVDEASLNLVRAGPGKWNLDALFRTAAAQTGPPTGASAPPRLPTLEATDLRIDFKNGAEKLPFSLVNADLTVWQENPGEWRVRLRGQPARTDVSLYLEDTGVVRMEASVRRAPAKRLMPIHLDLDWHQAQLGQLARLVTGSDSGWRGDLTGELHLDGTADAAQIAMRLRASSVHREEFVPVSPLDFDAKCNVLYHYTARSLQNLVCDSPLGDGRVHLTGKMPGPQATPSLTLELNRIPVAAGLDALRTLRSGLQPDLEAAGTVSGKLVYAERKTQDSGIPIPAEPGANRLPRTAQEESGPLTGSLTVENLALTGGGLTRPIQAARIVLAPVEPASAIARTNAMVNAQPSSKIKVRAGHLQDAASAPTGNTNAGDALVGSVAIPAGGSVPLTFGLRFSLSGYQIAARGQASIPRAREIAHAAGIRETVVLQSLAGDPIAVDLVAQGPWLPKEEIPISEISVPQPAVLPAAQPPEFSTASAGATDSDTVTGTVTLHNANWKADYLASPLEISEATLHLDPAVLRWDPIVFAFGPVKGTATVTLPQGCTPEAAGICPAELPPFFTLTFGDLDAASFQAALLGARERGTLLSTLIDRLHPSTAPPWPQMQGSIAAASLVLGPVQLEKISSTLQILPDGASVTSFTAGLLGGRMQISGSLHKPETDQDKPSYSFTGDFEDVDARALGQFLGLRWSGSSVRGNGKVDLVGYTGADLAASAKGTLHIESRFGSIAAIAKAEPETDVDAAKLPVPLGRFEHLNADATIANGTVTLEQCQVISGGHKRSVNANVTIADPPQVNFEAPKPSVARR
ncbi:MAG: AsmA family protein [Terracidiphilus sp.]